MEIIGRQGVYVALEDDRIEKIRLVVMDRNLSLIHISEPTRPRFGSRMPSSA